MSIINTSLLQLPTQTLRPNDLHQISLDQTNWLLWWSFISCCHKKWWREFQFQAGDISSRPLLHLDLSLPTSITPPHSETRNSIFGRYPPVPVSMLSTSPLLQDKALSSIIVLLLLLPETTTTTCATTALLGLPWQNFRRWRFPWVRLLLCSNQSPLNCWYPLHPPST